MRAHTKSATQTNEWAYVCVCVGVPHSSYSAIFRGRFQLFCDMALERGLMKFHDKILHIIFCTFGGFVCMCEWVICTINAIKEAVNGFQVNRKKKRKVHKHTHTHIYTIYSDNVGGSGKAADWIEFERTNEKKTQSTMAKNFNYYFGLAHKTHKLTIKVRLMQNLCLAKLEHFPREKKKHTHKLQINILVPLKWLLKAHIVRSYMPVEARKNT